MYVCVCVCVISLEIAACCLNCLEMVILKVCILSRGKAEDLHFLSACGHARNLAN